MRPTNVVEIDPGEIEITRKSSCYVEHFGEVVGIDILLLLAVTELSFDQIPVSGELERTVAAGTVDRDHVVEARIAVVPEAVVVVG